MYECSRRVSGRIRVCVSGRRHSSEAESEGGRIRLPGAGVKRRKASLKPRASSPRSSVCVCVCAMTVSRCEAATATATYRPQHPPCTFSFRLAVIASNGVQFVVGQNRELRRASRQLAAHSIQNLTFDSVGSLRHEPHHNRVSRGDDYDAISKPSTLLIRRHLVSRIIIIVKIKQVCGPNSAKPVLCDHPSSVMQHVTSSPHRLSSGSIYPRLVPGQFSRAHKRCKLLYNSNATNRHTM